MHKKATSPRSDSGRSIALFVLMYGTNPLHSWLLQEKSTQTFLRQNPIPPTIISTPSCYRTCSIQTRGRHFNIPPLTVRFIMTCSKQFCPKLN